LLLSKSHNCSVGNKPFADKRASYTHLEQQREIQELTKENPTWTRELIQKGKKNYTVFNEKNITKEGSPVPNRVDGSAIN